MSTDQLTTLQLHVQVSRDIAVSNLTALIARDEYVLEESYSGEEEPDDDAEEVKQDRVQKDQF